MDFTHAIELPIRLHKNNNDAWHSLDMGSIYTEIWELDADIYVWHIPNSVDLHKWMAISAMNSR